MVYFINISLQSKVRLIKVHRKIWNLNKKNRLEQKFFETKLKAEAERSLFITKFIYSDQRNMYVQY